MLALTGSLRYYFVDGVTDMRLGQYRLCRVIEQLLHRNPYNGDVFIFMNKSRRVIKIIRYDNEAYILYVKALDRDLKFMKIKGDSPVISEDGFRTSLSDKMETAHSWGLALRLSLKGQV